MVADLEAAQPAALALRRLQRRERPARIGGDRAQRVELGVRARPQRLALAGLGRIVGQRRRQRLGGLARAAEVGGDRRRRAAGRARLRGQLRQPLQAAPQLQQLPRPRAARPHAPQQPLQIRQPAQRAPQRRARQRRLEPSRELVEPRLGRRRVAQRTPQPLAQQPRARPRQRAIERPQQRALGPARALEQLQRAPRLRVERDELAGPRRARRAQLAQRLRPRLLKVAEQRPRRPHGRVQPRQPEAVEAGHAVALAECARRRGGRERPRRPRRAPRLRREVFGQRPGRALGQQQLARRQPRQLPAQRALGDELALQLAGGRVAGREAPASLAVPAAPPRRRLRGERHEPVVAALRQQHAALDGAGRDDAQHAPLDEPAAGGLDLLGERDAQSRRHELIEVAFERVVRDPGHRHAALALAERPRGERDAERLRQPRRILVERLVEVAHAEQQQRIAMLRLERQILPADGGGQGVNTPLRGCVPV